VGKKIRKLTGRIVKGVRKASFFTELDWVQDQCVAKLGFKPYPGTLNLRIEKGLSVLDQLQKEACHELIPPTKEFCTAKIYPVIIGNESGAILIPDEDVRVHGSAIVEIISPNRIKDALNVDDGDSLIVVINDTDKSMSSDEISDSRET